jgi:predicted PurR-regulated permease PerM
MKLGLLKENRKPGEGPHLWEITAVRDLMWTGLAVFFLAVVFYLRSILLPVFFGLFFAYLSNPAVKLAQKKIRMPKQLTIIFLLTLAIAAIIAASIWLVPPLIEQGTNLVQSLPDYWETLRDEYGVPLGEFPEKPGAFLGKLDVQSESIIPFIGSVIGTSVMVLFWIILIPFSFVVFSMNFDNIVRKIKNYIPLEQRDRYLRLFDRLDKAVGSFFRGRMLISLIISVLFSAGWFLAGVPYWFILGIATGFLSIVPYLSTIGWLSVILVKYLEMTTGAQAAGFDFLAVLVWPTVVYQGVNVIEEYILTPWVQSKSTTLNPLTILVVVFIGGWIGGLFGLFFAIPAAACIKIIWEEFAMPRLIYGRKNR